MTPWYDAFLPGDRVMIVFPANSIIIPELHRRPVLQSQHIQAARLKNNGLTLGTLESLNLINSTVRRQCAVAGLVKIHRNLCSVVQATGKTNLELVAAFSTDEILPNASKFLLCSRDTLLARFELLFLERIVYDVM
jgi:hypothetical protein